MLDTHHTVEVPEGIEIQLPLAGLVERSLAFLVDFMLRFAIFFGCAIVLEWLGEFGQGAFWIVFFVLDWFYPILFEMFNNGATPGKRVMRLRVVNDDTTPVTWGSSLVRNLLRAADQFPGVYLVGLISMLFNSEFKRLGDLAAGTIVVHDAEFSNKGEMPEVKPKHLSVALTVDEQSAILNYAERSQKLSEARCDELAEVLATVLEADTPNQAKQSLFAVANWLRGRR